MKIWTDSNDNIINWELEQKDTLFPLFCCDKKDIIGIRSNVERNRINICVNSSFLNNYLCLTMVNTNEKLYIKRLDSEQNKNNKKIYTVKYYSTDQIEMDYVLADFLKTIK